MRKILLTFLSALLCSVTAWADTEIIKVELSGSKGATQTVTGSIGGTSSVNSLGSSSPYKLNNNGAYVSLTLSSGYFQATDNVEINGSKAMQIYYGTPGSGTFLLTTGAPVAGKITTALTGLPASQNTIYVYRSSDTYNGTLSYITVTRAASCDAAPTAPTGLSAGSITAGGATFTITDAANTNNYEIYCSTSSTAPIASTVATATGTSKTIAVSGLTPSSTYYAWVRSVCDATYKSAWVALTSSTFTTEDCPSSGTLYTLTAKSTTYSVPGETETNMVSTYATVSGGGAYIGNQSSSSGKAQVKTDGSGTVFFNGGGGYVKLVLDCPIQTGDVLSFVSGSGSNQLAFTTTDSRATTYPSTDNTYTFPAAFNGVSTIYVWRASDNGTYMHSLEITRSGGCSVSSAEAGANKSTTVNTAVALAATAAGSGKTGTWSITSKPDGSTASTSSFSDVNSATATFTPDKVGDYTLTWTVECDDDDTETASDNMTVTANCIAISPTLSYASVGGTTLDVGDSSSGSPTVSGNTGSGTVSYEVTSASPAGCLTVNALTGVASAVAAGSATVTATVAASGNYCGNTATANFTIADDCTDPELTITLN